MQPQQLATILVAALFAAAPSAAGAAGASDLEELAAVSSPSGHEGALRETIRRALPEGLETSVDNLGNLIVRGGTGSPHRLIFTPMDEPGLVVSRITEKGFLRVHPLGGVGPGGIVLRFFEGKRVVVRSAGSLLPGAVMTTSIHLRGKRPDRFRIDDIWVDIGASSPEEVEAAGVTVLSPITLTKRMQSLAGGRVAGVALSHRFGCAVLLDVARRWAESPPDGSWTIAWTAQDLVRRRGVERLAQEVHPDEVYYVGRLRPRRDGNVWVYPEGTLGEGALVGSAAGALAVPDSLPTQEISWRSGGLERLFGDGVQVHLLSVPVLYPDTPAEVIDRKDIDSLRAVLLSLGRKVR